MVFRQPDMKLFHVRDRWLVAMVTRHGVRLAAFLAQAHPRPALLRVNVLDLHAELRHRCGRSCKPSSRSVPGRAALPSS
jgi:hypothetical protein